MGFWMKSFFWTLISAICLFQWLMSPLSPVITRLRSDHAPRQPFGIVQVDGFGSDGRENGIDIVFVHGLGSNPDTTWSLPVEDDKQSGNESSVRWIRDFLPDDILPTHRDNIRVFYYNHDTYFWRDAPQSDLETLALAMLSRIKSQIRRNEQEWNRKLILVGHSYGGLIIKQAIVEAAKNERFLHIAQNTKALVFLGTPHRGSKSANLFAPIASALTPIGSNSKILKDLAYDSPHLLGLHTDFLRVTRQMRVVNFYEERKSSTKIGPVKLFVEFVVEVQSATFTTGSDRSVENIPLPLDHFKIVRFNKRDSNYHIIKDKLNELILLPLEVKQARYFSVPLSTVHTYTERETISAEIERKLRIRHEKSSVPYAIAVHGLGGTGKSQLALRYIDQHKHEFNAVMWIDGKDNESTLSSYTEFAVQIGLSLQTNSHWSESTKQGVIQLVNAWFEDQSEPDQKWLVVVDNADDVRWGLKKLLPRGIRGSIIITSQDSKSRGLVDGLCEDVHVGVMELHEARLLLLNHLEWLSDDLSDVVRQECDTLVQRLGLLALATDLAGAYIKYDDSPNHQSLKQYIKNLDRHEDELLQNDDFVGLSFTDKTVWTVWSTTLSKIDSLNYAIKPSFLLAFLAHFRGLIVQHDIFRLASLQLHSEPTTIWQERLLPAELKSLFTVKNNEWDPFYYEQALEPLTRFHLVGKTEGARPGVAMHNLVKWRALKYEIGLPWKIWNIKMIEKAYRHTQYLGSEFLYLVDHFPSIDDICRLTGPDPLGTFAYRRLFGHIYLHLGRWENAETILVSGLTYLQQACLGDHQCGEDPGLWNGYQASFIDGIVTARRKQGHLDEAKELGEVLLADCTRVLGETNPITLCVMNNLAVTYHELNMYDLAEKLHADLSRIFQQNPQLHQSINPGTVINGAAAFGDRSDQSGSILANKRNLAHTYMLRGKVKEAQSLLEDSLDESLLSHGRMHHLTVNIMYTLGYVYRIQGHLEEAEKNLFSALELGKKLNGPNHHLTFDTTWSLTRTYMLQERYEKAEPLAQSLLTAYEESPHGEESMIASSQMLLAVIYDRLGKLQEAEKLLVAVVEYHEGSKNADPADLTEARIFLSSILFELDRPQAAIYSLATKSQDSDWRSPDFGAPNWVLNLSSLYLRRGRLRASEKLLAPVLEADSNYTGLDAVRLMIQLVKTHALQRNWQKAHDVGVQALKTSKMVPGPPDQDVLTLMKDLEGIYWAQHHVCTEAGIDFTNAWRQ
ncbi:uncharacterized protein N7482_007876 [Penicillium canariense]|uniref:GPI inositol-deacylase n=1 Tax=Penicillium canariense TaxID=189055 RepID=A0A9W9I0I0_9EURO|nr:uncharacterized protein N7482_007876 [Penicillium canariense]KAJ5160872.1 hypothetical protein N7482_007876 [Penicillium canariense]